jgi:DNA-binding CsgD family transcriptional regulator
VLNLARTQLVARYQAAVDAREHAAVIDSMDRALDDLHRGVIVVDPDGRLLAATATAARLLGTHLGVRPSRGQLLPARLASLGRGAASRAHPVSLQGQGAVLSAAVLGDTHNGPRTIAIDERPTGTRPSLSEAELTARENNILGLVARGHNNTEIASTLGVSIRTVHKHLEHLYTKLDVHDRTAAASRWFSQHGPTPA